MNAFRVILGCFSIRLCARVIGGFLAIGGSATAAISPITSTHESYDVVVVGAGTSGIAAAIQAARMGAHVALLEETDWVGGQEAAAGVGTIDGGQWLNNSGVFSEFVKRVKLFYASEKKSYSTCYWDAKSICVEPHVARAIFLKMIAQEPKIDLLLREHIVSTIETSISDGAGGARSILTGVLAFNTARATSTTYFSPVVVDATEFGDVLQLTSQRYRLGVNVTSGAVGAKGQVIYDDGGTTTVTPQGLPITLADTAVQNFAYVAVIRRYPAGVPADLLVNEPPPGYETVRESFPKVVAVDGHNSPEEPMNWNNYVAYRGLPDSASPVSYDASTPAAITRTSINLGNDMATDGWLFARGSRGGIQCRAKLRTLNFLYYIQHELGMTDWSVADDEGYDTPYNKANACPEIPVAYKAIEVQMPVMPYVRESLRMIGIGTENVGEIIRYGCYPDTAAMFTFSTSVALGDYPVDMHGFFGIEKNLDSQKDVDYIFAHDYTNNHSGPFEIPFDAFISEDIDGLIAAEKNISQSRYASAASREQPATMDIGQAAGTIAAIAALDHKPPRTVSALHVQELLHSSGAMVKIGDVASYKPSGPCVDSK